MDDIKMRRDPKARMVGFDCAAPCVQPSGQGIGRLGDYPACLHSKGCLQIPEAHLLRE